MVEKLFDKKENWKQFHASRRQCFHRLRVSAIGCGKMLWDSVTTGVVLGI